jgi:ATP-dependent DNA helicase RecQ
MAESIFCQERANPWVLFLLRALQAWQNESADAELPVAHALEFLYECCAESRRDLSYGKGMTLSTVHSAKGTEFDHVLLIGAWPLNPERSKQEETRRAFYVGMTRARYTLVVFDRKDIRISLPSTLVGPAIICRDFETQAEQSSRVLLNYTTLGLEDIRLGYAGQFPQSHAVHTALAGSKPGDRLALRATDGSGIGLFTQRGSCVAHLSHRAGAVWSDRLEAVREVRLLALVHRSVEQESDEGWRERCRVAEWEIPVAEVVFEENPLR